MLKSRQPFIKLQRDTARNQTNETTELSSISLAHHTIGAASEVLNDKRDGLVRITEHVLIYVEVRNSLVLLSNCSAVLK